MNYFKDKICIITGGARGFGRYLAFRLAEKGCNIIICDIDKKELNRTKKDLQAETGRKVLAPGVNVTSEADVNSMVEAATKEFGRIDFLVSNENYFKFTIINGKKTWILNSIYDKIDIVLKDIHFASEMPERMVSLL